MNEPLLTVCLITYNQAPYVEQSLDSIFMQKTDFAWELVIADDYSTDGTRKILQEYKKRYPKQVKLILQKSNKGPEDNWLDLISYPRTKYVLYAEGDDYFTDPSKLQRQVNFLESHPDFTICFHPVKVIYEGESHPDEIFPTPEQRYHKTTLDLADLLKSNFIQTNSEMYRWRFRTENARDVLPQNVAPGDWLLHILHAEQGKIGFINRVMTTYRRHPGSLWWKKNSAFWLKNGQRHMRMYQELLKRYGDVPAYRDAINGPTMFVFKAIASLPTQQGEDLLAQIIDEFPVLTATLIRSELALSANQAKQSEQLINLNNAHIKKLNSHIAKQTADIKFLENEVRRATNQPLVEETP